MIKDSTPIRRVQNLPCTHPQAEAFLQFAKTSMASVSRGLTTPARAIGLPFLPVTPTFPWLGPLGFLPLPTKWVIRIGEPLSLGHLAPDSAQDELLISRLTEDLRKLCAELESCAPEPAQRAARRSRAKS